MEGAGESTELCRPNKRNIFLYLFTFSLNAFEWPLALGSTNFRFFRRKQKIPIFISEDINKKFRFSGDGDGGEGEGDGDGDGTGAGIVDGGSDQCDHIERFLKVLGYNFSSKSSPNVLWLFGLFWKT